MDGNHSHLGYCSYCHRRIYWVWRYEHWAPFEAWVEGVERGQWIFHYC